MWKNAYQSEWIHGNRRENKIKELIESWGFIVDYFGFHAGDTEFDFRYSKESGIPDLIIHTRNKKVLVEVTGSKYSRGIDLWVRPDKFYYARRHREYDVWIAHIIESSNIIRFIKGLKKDCTEIQQIIRGNIETFISIQPNDKDIISIKEFKNYLYKLNGDINNPQSLFFYNKKNKP